MAVITIDPRDATPIYAQVERGLRAAIASGRLAAGAQLPTVRQMAVDLQVNANTIARVYSELERAGVIETRRGVGSFISATPAQARPPRDRERRLRAFATRVLADADAAGFTIDDLVRALDAHRPAASHVPGGRAASVPGTTGTGRSLRGRQEGR